MVVWCVICVTQSAVHSETHGKPDAISTKKITDHNEVGETIEVISPTTFITPPDFPFSAGTNSENLSLTNVENVK